MSELDVQRRLTKAFIALAEPVVVTLVPRSKLAQPGGGFRWQAETPRVAQTMKLVEPVQTPLPIVTVDGQEREIIFSLIGEWDAVIGMYDIFTFLDGFVYEVVQIQPYNGWERRALVARHG